VRKRIFGPKRNEVTGVWRGLHNVELHTSNAIRMMKFRRIRCAGNVAGRGEMRNICEILAEGQTGIDS
jgi:hypothetical protein